MMQLRRSQKEVLTYTGGYMAVSAVPGSGKTTTLSLLAVELIERHGFGRLDEHSLRRQLVEERALSANGLAAGEKEPELPQVLIVTFSNAAVANFKSKIAGFLRERGLPQHAGYDVRTLHSLAHWIVQQAPGEVGLDPEYDILGEIEFHRGVTVAVQRYLTRRRDAVLAALKPSLPESDNALRKLLRDLANTTIRTAKMMRLRPEELLRRLAGITDGPAVRLAMLGAELYAAYQEYLNQRASLDFDDLVWLAYDLLQNNPTLLRRLQRRWPYILEDEAQDSSPLQEKILALLSASHHNWVRVGDPNQAINATFTSADPRYFRRFCERPDVRLVQLDEAGRSTLPIIHLANALVKWTCERHPEAEIRRRAFACQMIHPVPQDDPQPNPPASDSAIHLTREFPTWEMEVREICRRAKQYAQAFPHHTIAILVPTNILGSQVVKELSELGVNYEDLLREPSQARSVLQVLAGIVGFAAFPRSGDRLAELFGTLLDAHVFGEPPEGTNASRMMALLRSVPAEKLLFPEPGKSRRQALPPVESLPEEAYNIIEGFAERAAGWLRASLLPIDEFVLTIGTELFHTPFQLALVQQIAATMRRAADMNPSWRLPDLARALTDLSTDPRSLPQMGFRELGYTPQPGVINVATLHGAKGLEWDLVYILGADRAWFPEHPDQVWMESWGIMEGSEREEVTELIRALSDEHDVPRGGPPTREAQLEHIAERLRLLYVGITRARRRLCISWSRRRLVGGLFGDLRDMETEISPALERLRQFHEHAVKEGFTSEVE
ncbi:MAG: ATP-dependent helicase [Anaerolineae bacterium]